MQSQALTGHASRRNPQWSSNTAEEMIIEPRKGYGELLLGSSRSKVIEQLGKPVQCTMEGDVEYYEYSSPDLTLGFSSCDGDRLGTITVRDESALFNGRRIIGRMIEDVLRENLSIVLEDDFEESGMDFFDGSNDISIWVNDGKDTNVTLFPDWIDDDTPLWPF